MTAWLHLQTNAPDFSTPIISYGWPAAVKAPDLTERQREFLDETEHAVEFERSVPAGLWFLNAIWVGKLEPINLLPTQAHIDSASLARLDEAEDLPHIIVLLSNGKHYIHDGHHRATRAMLRNELIDAAVVNLEMIK